MAPKLDMPGNRPLSRAAEPLRAGERISRSEFEQRFDATVGLKFAELIEGVVVMPPPVRDSNHGSPHANLIGYLEYYRWSTPGIVVYDNASIRLDLQNMPQPDAAVLIDPSFGGQAIISGDDYVEGAPELVAEVSASSADIDLTTKLRVYQRNGVTEYIVWRVFEQKCDWFSLSPAGCVPLPVHPDGATRSQSLPGLWLDLTALSARNVHGVLRGLDEGLASPEHATFVRRANGI